jgi:hypothetical protein
MFLVHVPGERDTKFSFSFEQGWSVYFVEMLFPYSQLTTKYLLTTSSEALLHYIFETEFINHFFEQKLGRILLEITASPSYKDDIPKMIQDCSHILQMREVHEYIARYLLETSEKEDLLGPPKGQKMDTNQPLYKCLNENLISNLCALMARVINQLDTNDNFTVLLRRDPAIPEAELRRLFVYLLSKFKKLSKVMAHNGTSFPACFPFSFYLIEIFQMNLDDEHEVYLWRRHLLGLKLLKFWPLIGEPT